MKIGILTHYNVYNMGAQLQMISLEAYLKELGHKVIILTYEKNFDYLEGEKERNSASWKALPFYIKHYLFEKGPALTLFNYRKVKAIDRAKGTHVFTPYDKSGCDAIVIGSDEVFSVDVGLNPMMYGYGLGDVPAIAYAPAFGRTTEEILYERGCYGLVRDGLKGMFRLSARDAHTREMIMSMTGREVPLVCDPVLLYDGSVFEGRIKPIGKPYLLLYAYDANMTGPKEISAIRTYAKKHGLITVSAGTYHKWCDMNIACGPAEWYGYFKEAACVVTDTFHGSIAAMKNKCRMAVFVRESINAFKLKSLLEVTGLRDRRLNAVTEDELERVLSTPVDYVETERRISALAEESGRYLKDALECVKNGEHTKAN
ncbi:MAG: polysaccharide pyruvyl transferase family protein [Clostridia bacterium]|nr:polysaccharide pyruvyl transferase family protein [Clostridia bacterium]